MDFSKLKNKLLLLLCVFVVLFPFWLIKGLCAEPETVEFDTIPNLTITSTANYFTTSTGSVGYIELEKGYIYYFHNNNPNTSRGIALSNTIPELNGTYEFLTALEGGGDYSYLCSSTNTYIYIDFSAGSGSAITVTREKVGGVDSSINDLVNNIGLESMWGIFENSINYIYIVIAVAFGVGLITYLISKISKGRE